MTDEGAAEKKRGAERTQPATRNEEWSDERIKLFLDIEPPADLPRDYAILLKAYRGMTAELFARFVPFFVAAGHDINTRLEDGSTFLDLVAQHRRSADYALALESHGAKPSA
ncbi:MAG: hypothetical protein RLZZ385_1710 [Pseudomonadota bacterium]